LFVNSLTRFDELRLRTDRQLLRLAHADLDTGLRAARACFSRPEFRGAAERSYSNAAWLARMVDLGMEHTAELGIQTVSEDECRSLQARLGHLRLVMEEAASVQELCAA
jgi:hypothetical protein